MSRSTLSPVRRFVAVLALAGVAGLGSITAAPAALADEPVAAAPVVEEAQPLVVTLPNVQKELRQALPALLAPGFVPQIVKSPMPDAEVTFKVGHLQLTLPQRYAQPAQTALATLYTSLGYTVVFDSHGRLVIGPKFCKPNKKAEEQLGCVPTGGPRF
jgi:hypothetical protein